MRIGKMIGWCIFLFIGCSQQNNNDNRLEDALQLSGENRHELEHVLQYFSENPADSLKLKAAIFLIENMPGHWQPDSCCTHNYIARLDSLKHLPVLTRKVLLTYPAEHPELCPDFTPIEDVKNLKADFLIRHIQSIFTLKDSCPWLAHVDFDLFCEYLLPYRFGNEILETSPTPIPDSNFYHAVGYAKQNYDDCQHSIQALTSYLERLHFPPIIPKNDTELYHLLLSDNNPTKESLIKFRAAGIPTVTDFSPTQRSQEKVTHWLCHQDPRIYNRNIYTIENLRIGKIYRQTYSHNPIPLASEYVPPFFRNPFYKDVTAHYLHTADIQLTVPTNINEKYAYLTVYDDSIWQPIAYSRIKEGNCRFTQLARNCIYLPVHYPNKNRQAFAAPFILRKDGKTVPLDIDKDSLQTLSIRRLHPYPITIDYMNEYLRNARFECADHSKFLDPDTVYTVKKLTYFNYDTIRPDSHFKKRYWRIIPRLGISHLAELYFYDSSGKAIPGKPIGPDTTHYQNLTDHNPGSSKYISGWFGYDFGNPISISEIVYLSFSDHEDICPDHEYELYYFENSQWRSAGIQIAKDHFIEFKQIPSSTLYQVKDITQNKLGCLFTWENGKIRFW